MSALAEALLAAQRQAIGAASKAFVAGTLNETDLFELLDDIGARDTVEQAQMLACLHALQRFGSSVTNGTPPTPKEAKPASDAQWKLLRRLADERSVPAPDGPLTVEQASKVIEELKAGTYNADAWSIPF
jgi:hypothetical protein